MTSFGAQFVVWLMARMRASITKCVRLSARTATHYKSFRRLGQSIGAHPPLF